MMEEKELLHVYSAAYDHLDGKNIYEVRNLARAFGVHQPTSTRKHDLILHIIATAAGVEEPGPRSRRGARVKADKASEQSIAEVRRIVEDCRAAAPYRTAEEEKEIEFCDAGGFGYKDKCMAGFLEIAPSGYGRLYSEYSGQEPAVPERLIREYDLREGDLVSGYVSDEEPPRVVRIAAVNGYPPAVSGRRRFEDFPAAFPNERFVLGKNVAVLRAADLLCPVGKGQRLLVAAPAGTGKTTFLREAARSIAAAGDTELLCVLIDQRPEESLELREAVPQASVVDAPFDSTHARRVRAAHLALERAKRLAESGKDAALFLDSLTALVRALADRAQAGSEQAAIAEAKKFFAAARRLEGGGSLTIFATAAVGADPFESEICGEFSAAANAVVFLSEEIAAQGIIPAIDFARSFARRGDALLGGEQKEAARRLRTVAAEKGTAGVLESAEVAE